MGVCNFSLLYDVFVRGKCVAWQLQPSPLMLRLVCRVIQQGPAATRQVERCHYCSHSTQRISLFYCDTKRNCLGCSCSVASFSIQTYTSNLVRSDPRSLPYYADEQLLVKVWNLYWKMPQRKVLLSGIPWVSDSSPSSHLGLGMRACSKRVCMNNKKQSSGPHGAVKTCRKRCRLRVIEIRHT